MSETEEERWSPIPGKMSADLAQEFAVYSLARDVEQTNLVFLTFAALSACNLVIDLLFGVNEFVILNSFFLLLALCSSVLLRFVDNHRLLKYIVNIVAFLVFAAIVVAKHTAVSNEVWFMYLADLMIIAAFCLTVPVNLVQKIVYSGIIVLLDVQSLVQTSIPVTTQSGVVLILVSTLVFCLTVYYKMQQAHFAAFINLRKEQRVNEELRSAQWQIGELQELLPVCANCKKVRDDNGYWEQIDKYIKAKLDIHVSHGVCPDCIEELYSGYRSQL